VLTAEAQQLFARQRACRPRTSTACRHRDCSRARHSGSPSYGGLPRRRLRFTSRTRTGIGQIARGRGVDRTERTDAALSVVAGHMAGLQAWLRAALSTVRMRFARAARGCPRRSRPSCDDPVRGRTCSGRAPFSAISWCQSSIWRAAASTGVGGGRQDMRPDHGAGVVGASAPRRT
jgi:hypothetical protein